MQRKGGCKVTRARDREREQISSHKEKYVHCTCPFSIAPLTLHPPLSLHPLPCTPPFLCTPCFAPPLCFAPLALHGMKFSENKESKSQFSVKNEGRKSQISGGVCMYQLPWTPPLDLEFYSRVALQMDLDYVII